MIFADVALVVGILIGLYGPKTVDLKPLFVVLVCVYAVAFLSRGGYHGDQGINNP